MTYAFGGRIPLDAGRTWRGRRVLGDGVTVDGVAAGVAAGILLGAALNAARGAVASATGILPPAFPAPVAVALPLGALLGDAAASFVKRRVDVAQGRPFPVLDQVDFALGAIPAVFLAAPVWAAGVLTLPVVAGMVLLIPLLRLGGSRLYHRAGWKDDPW